MAAKSAGNLAKGDYVEFHDAPHMVTKTEFMNPGKGSAIMRVRLKNVQTGAVYDFTYKAAETVALLNVDKKEMQYLYHDDREVAFMDPKTYEQATVPTDLLEDQLGFLIPDVLCWVLWYEDRAIGVVLPPHVRLRVVETEDAIAGNRVNAPKKLAKMETGAEIQVPLFVKVGDLLEIDTASGQYVARAN
jgi:elongation factor P